MAEPKSENSEKYDLRHRLLIVLEDAVGQARLTRDEAMSLLGMFDHNQKATTETIWAIAFRGETENYVCMDEYWDLREYAEDAIADIRENVAAGKYPAEEFEPIVLMQGTLTTLRPIEGGWKPVTSSDLDTATEARHD